MLPRRGEYRALKNRQDIVIQLLAVVKINLIIFKRLFFVPRSISQIGAKPVESVITLKYIANSS